MADWSERPQKHVGMLRFAADENVSHAVTSCPDTQVTVVFLNSYDMKVARSEWKAGRYPGHHLYGTAGIADPFVVQDVVRTGRDHGVLAGALSARFGDIEFQVVTSVSRGQRAIVYSADADLIRFLSLARRVGLWSLPIVGVCHRVPESRRQQILSPYRGFDRVISLSSFATARLLEIGIQREKVVTLGWGPDASFSDFITIAHSDPPADASIVSLGKTQRDLITLLRALIQTKSRARVYGDDSLMDRMSLPDTIELVQPISSYPSVLEDLRNAALVTIPLLTTRPVMGHVGLTEIGEAMACGRPIIATRASYFDVDIEEVGCGWWVEQGDVDGWIDRITYAMADRDRLTEMGQRGRRWVEEEWNSDHFGDGVRDVLMAMRPRSWAM